MTASQPLPLAELPPAELAEIERFGIFEAEEKVEKVARALWLADNPALTMFGPDELDALWAHNRNDHYRRLAAAAIAVMPVSPAEEALRRCEALAETWEARHSGWCCTQSCPEPDERHPDPTDPVYLDELAGMWSDNPPPLIEHRTIPCPGTCTCQVGPYIASIRAAIAATQTGEHTTDEEGQR